MTDINKYIPYLHLKHNYEGLNCLTIIEKLYKDFLHIELNNIWKRTGREDGSTDVNSRWYQKYTMVDVENEVAHWKKVDITDIKEYDVIVFVSKRNRPLHFGMSTGYNNFIHLPEKSTCHISELDMTWRERIYGIYRHNELV